ncbi:MAG: Ykof family thiamine-binding protein [Candidatus Devosia euplotis]|nr:Ykof family thiamine-binding protein [Candidatus Devosia euplotis]
MYFGAQISLYPMADDFVGVITSALGALYRERLRIESDDLSTLLVGPPESVFPAMRDLFSMAEKTGVHCTLSATISRGCPGEPHDSRCESPQLDDPMSPWQNGRPVHWQALSRPRSGVDIAAQFSLYVMGTDDHMDEIYGCIDFLKTSGALDRPKNFCTRLDGDAGAVSAALEAAICNFGLLQGHVTIDLTVSANSPSLRQ